MHAIARALRRRPDLAEPLRLLLGQVAETDAPAEPLPDLAGLVRRLDEVERQVAQHAALLALRSPLPSVAEPEAGKLHALQPALQIPTASRRRSGAAGKAPAEPWTIGEGRMKRLTAAGLVELDRRLAAGEADAAIAAAIGVSAQTVNKRRGAAA